MENKEEYNIFDFVKEGITPYPSMYEIVGKYLPELKNNFSPSNLVNNLLESSKNIEQHGIIEKSYEEVFKKLADMLLLASDNSVTVPDKFQSIKRELTEEEKQNLYNDLKKSLSENVYFNSIWDYLQYAKKNCKAPENKKFRETIVNKSVEVASKSEMNMLKKILLSYYISAAKTELKNDITIDQETKEKDLQLIEYIRMTLSNSMKLQEYDDYLENCYERIKCAERKIIQSQARNSKRNTFVNDSIMQSFTREELADARKNGIETIVFAGKGGTSAYNEGDIEWSIEKYEKPVVLCDMLANYSNKGDENQRVIAVSYGKFHYDNKISNAKNTLIQPELIGVTRIGKDDEIYNYFVLVPLDTISFRDGSNLQDGENRYNFYINGKEATIRDYATNKKLYAVESNKIPDDLQDFYIKTFFSDMYLEKVVEDNYRYTGYVSRTPNGARIHGFDIGRNDLSAAQYASMYSGKIGEYTYSSLSDYCESPKFIKSHINLVTEVSKGDYEYPESDVIEESSFTRNDESDTFFPEW